MDNDFRKGFMKIAQDDTAEVAQPEERDKETILTCMSDCAYAQNPEKRCMLDSVSFSMDEKSGSFVCGQYQQTQDTTEGEAPAPQEEEQVKKQPGLPGSPSK